jgi:hypothetical protein
VTTALADPIARPEVRAVLARGGGPTLDELVTGAWEDLVVRGHAACPVCGEGMRMAAGAPGRCGGCASELD